MARSIKSKRGKTLRRVLRARYAKKAEDHLKKIVEKAKSNDLVDIANMVYKPIPKRVRTAISRQNAEMETENPEEKNEAVEVKEDIKEEPEKADLSKFDRKKLRRLRHYNGNIESLRNKDGALPCWVSQRHIRKQFVTKKKKKSRTKLRSSLKLI